MKIGIFCKKTHQDLNKTIGSLFDKVKRINAKVFIHHDSIDLINEELLKSISHNLIKLPKNQYSELNYIITIGGDGTFLSGLSAFKYANVPMLGINTGRLGFLADISPSEINYALDCITKNEYRIEKRSMLKCTISEKPKEYSYALNEVAVFKQDSASIITIETYLNNEFLANYMADGLIISTATGSTAYSLSAGGPIMSPDSDCFVITPIAPHNLTARPLVIPSSKKISLKIISRDDEFRVSADTKSNVLKQKATIDIEKAKQSCILVKLNKHSFAKTIRNKLMWGIDKRF